MVRVLVIGEYVKEGVVVDHAAKELGGTEKGEQNLRWLSISFRRLFVSQKTKRDPYYTRGDRDRSEWDTG